MVCACMLGEKFDLVTIGKNENPRNHLEIRKLPLSYRFNKSAWMTETIFVDFLGELKKKMILLNEMKLKKSNPTFLKMYLKT